MFGLLGVDVARWLDELPRTLRAPMMAPVFNPRAPKRTLSQFFQSRRCVLCEEVTERSQLCTSCRADPQATMVFSSHGLREYMGCPFAFVTCPPCIASACCSPHRCHQPVILTCRNVASVAIITNPAILAALFPTAPFLDMNRSLFLTVARVEGTLQGS